MSDWESRNNWHYLNSQVGPTEKNQRLRALATELFEALQWLTIAAEEGTPARSEHVRMAQMALKKARQEGFHG